MKGEEIMKLRVVKMTVDQFIKHSNRFRVPLERTNILKLGNGAFLGVWKKKSGEMVRIHLKSIYLKSFNMKYSAHKDSKKGKELLISNFKLPNSLIIN